jgi:hypothetical protein
MICKHLEMFPVFHDNVKCLHHHQTKNFSTALHWFTEIRSGNPHILHYLDDFLFDGDANTSRCHETLENFTEKVQSVKKILSLWSYRDLTYIGKVTVIKTLALPILVQSLTSSPFLYRTQ